MIKQYRKKPVVIEAIQWDGSRKSTKEVLEFMGQVVDTKLQISCDKFDDYVSLANKEGLTIHTLEGDMTAQVGDYIIEGVNGELYPIKADIFAKTYEQVN